MTHKLYINAYFIILVAHPGARTWCHALPWWALRCCYLSQTAAAGKQNTLIDYDLMPINNY